ncbi:hypothetical protein HAX54_021906, partial [Datura stramonium]|nr:hypothetical protein [Datura stramonium]
MLHFYGKATVSRDLASPDSDDPHGLPTTGLGNVTSFHQAPVEFTPGTPTGDCSQGQVRPIHEISEATVGGMDFRPEFLNYGEARQPKSPGSGNPQ